MATSKSIVAWNHTADMLAMMFNGFFHPKKPLSREDFHPLLPKKKEDDIIPVGISALKVFVSGLKG